MELSTGGHPSCHSTHQLYAEQGGEGYKRLTGVDFKPLPMVWGGGSIRPSPGGYRERNQA